MYLRNADGGLSLVGFFDTGGQGSGPSVRFAGDGLDSSHSVELSRSGHWLFVANAGSDDVSVFRVLETGLRLTDLVSSGGSFPNSVTQHGGLIYVLNAAGEGNITGFRLGRFGKLDPIPGSTRTLAANQDPDRPDVLFNPTQVSFTPDGRQLVVTIKDGPDPNPLGGVPTGPGRVLVFSVDPHGLPSHTFTQNELSNEGPFGFSFDSRGNLITTLFVGGPNLTSAVGSFAIHPDGTLVPITRNLPNGEGDSCWIENNGTYAYSANYGTGTISSYVIHGDGSLELLDSRAGITDDLPSDCIGKIQGSTPLDLRITPDGHFLYNILPGSGAIAAWRINGDGSLEKIGEFPIVVPGIGLLDTVDGDMAPFEFGPGGSPAGIAVVDFADDDHE